MRLVGLFSDGSKAMDVVWFKGIATLKRKLLTDTDYVLFGKPSVFNGRWQMSHPEIESPLGPTPFTYFMLSARNEFIASAWRECSRPRQGRRDW